MGFIDRLLKRPLSRDQFAQMLIKRLRASRETGPIEYDAEQFRLRNSANCVYFLSNFYQQYQRLPRSEHESLLISFLTTWHTSALQAPQDFADAKADLLPAVRARSYLEIGLHCISDTLHSDADIPHQIIGEHLVATLVYDLPQSMMTVSSELLERWDITFYEAMEVAKDNLHQNTRQYAQLGDLYAVVSGDAYDASRLLLTEFIRSLKVNGDTIATVPNREALYVCGSEDNAGLELMAKLTKENFQHERSISGMAFRLDGDEWQFWLPPNNHPLYREFRELYMQTLGQTYAEQKDLLDKRHERDQTDVFVASYSGIENEKTGRIASYCMWSEGVDSLLPETDQVFFYRPHAPEDEKLAARGDWETVRRVAGDMMEPQGLYPERWRVTEFPSDGMLVEIGTGFE